MSQSSSVLQTDQLSEPDNLLTVDNLQVHFPVREGTFFQKTTGYVKAVDGVSFQIKRGETLGLVGESGCGKTTIGRCLLNLEAPTGGRVDFEGYDIINLKPEDMNIYRRKVQAVFQDPFSSLNPRMSVGDIIAEPLVIHEKGMTFIDRALRVGELLSICGLPANLADRYPHEMSGGQRQRVGIARALALRPEFIVCDEAVSALDVSIQAQIICLLEDLREEFGLTYLFIGHDLSVVRHLCHRVAVMYLGKIVEIGDCDEIFEDPKHPYTQALLTAVPIPDPEKEQGRSHTYLGGEVPSPMNPPPGCVFHPRCSLAEDSCKSQIPVPRELPSGRIVACPLS